MSLETTLVAGTFPVQSLQLSKPCHFPDADAVIEALLRRIEEHPTARLIAVFDHLEHAWETGAEIPPDVRAVKQVIYCFGTGFPSPEVVALCPRAIAVTESADQFLVNYMETPVPEFNHTMARWVRTLAEELP